MATTSYRKHTVAKVFDYICDNETPWVALGNFLNYWWAYAVDHRRELIEAPLAPAPTPEMQRWAAFCAAMVEWLCWEAELIARTPAPFQRRNIFGGDRMFLHKWDMAKQMQQKGQYFFLEASGNQAPHLPTQ